MIKLIRLLPLLPLLGISLHLQAQSQSQSPAPDIFKKFAVVSPTAASMVKYTDLPVSYYTGTPDITIPIYEVNTSFAKLPITLSYHGSGVRVSESAPPTGLGWTLNAGGVVSRTVLGIADDSSWQNNGLNWINQGYDLGNTTDYQQTPLLYNNGLDGVPDLYMYNFTGYSGKFIFADQIRQLPQTNLKITHASINEYQIITPDGNTYIFNATESSLNKSATTQSTTTNAWYLTKILSADKTDSIVLNYADADYLVQSGLNYSLDIMQNALGAYIIGTAAATSTYSASLFSKQLTSIVFKQGSVEFNIGWNTRQDLPAPDAGSVAIVNSIAIKNKQGTILKTIGLNYDYFTNGLAGTDNKRLKLTGVYFYPGSSTDSLQAEKYNFQYNNIPLPAKSSKAVDHWGFYNGATTNSTLIPSWSSCVDNPTPPSCYACTQDPLYAHYDGANREPNAAFVTAGMIQSISYPTGGSTLFEWEAHDIPNPNANTPSYHQGPIGDAQSSGTSATFVKDSAADFYVDPAIYPNGICAKFEAAMSIPGGQADDATAINHANGSAVIYKRQGRTSVSSLTFPYSSTGAYDKTTSINLQAGQTYFVLTSVRDAGFVVNGFLDGFIAGTSTAPQNSIVGGCRIKKMTFHDPVAGIDKTTRYEYRIPGSPAISSGLSSGTPIYQTPIHSFAFLGGAGLCNYYTQNGLRLGSSSIFSLGNGNHIGYSYVKEIVGDTSITGSTIYNYSNDFTNSLLGEFDASWRRGLLISKTTYSNTGLIRSNTTNHYKIDSRGYAGFEGRQIASYDANPCAPVNVYDPTYPVYVTLKSYGFPSEWLYMDSTAETLYDLQTPTLRITNSTTFYYDNASHKELTRTVRRLSDGTQAWSYSKYPLDYTLPGGTLTGEQKAIQDLQLANRQDLIEHYEQRLDPASPPAITTSAIYNTYTSTASSRGPIIQPDQLFKTEADPYFNNFIPTAVSGSTIGKDSHYALQYKINRCDSSYNITELTTVGNNTSAYIWDYGRTYLIAKVTGAGQQNIAYTSFEAEGTGNWSFTGTTTADTTSPTGKRCYNLSTGAMNRSGLTSTTNYIVSYWTKNTTAFSVSGSVSTAKGHTTNGWTYFEHRVSGQTSITISGTGYIDEVRLYPVTASMLTYSYDPLVGVTSECDAANHIIYYDYDGNNRLITIRDQDRKVLKQYDYQFYKTIAL